MSELEEMWESIKRDHPVQAAMSVLKLWRSESKRTKVWVVYDWVLELPVGVYGTEEKARAVCEARAVGDFERMARTDPRGGSWRYAEFEMDAKSDPTEGDWVY